MSLVECHSMCVASTSQWSCGQLWWWNG